MAVDMRNRQDNAIRREYNHRAERRIVEEAQTVSLRGVRRGDVGRGARRSNLDLRFPVS
jgi:hypothetical protein